MKLLFITVVLLSLVGCNTTEPTNKEEDIKYETPILTNPNIITYD